MLLPFFILVAGVIANFLLLVVDGKTTCFISSIMADVLPWWLMLLPLSCKLYKMADVIAMVFFFFFFFFFLWLMLLPLGTLVLADVIAMVADVITTQGDWGALADVKANVVDVITTGQHLL